MPINAASRGLSREFQDPPPGPVTAVPAADPRKRSRLPLPVPGRTRILFSRIRCRPTNLQNWMPVTSGGGINPARSFRRVAGRRFVKGALPGGPVGPRREAEKIKVAREKEKTGAEKEMEWLREKLWEDWDEKLEMRLAGNIEGISSYGFILFF